ncbi:MAG: alpha-glucan family phosphorylase [Deltaproteobacteria bacterium]|jgi:starch phosphorylase|nr:alpha-glucan family phosphorylase [Deltaproteobacteria bacterium]
MKAKQEFKVIPRIPERLQPLKRMAYNVMFSWHSEIRDIFQRIDPKLWEESGHNPVLLMGLVDQKRLDELSHDIGFTSQLDEVAHRFDVYVSAPAESARDTCIAYFSAEFGLTTCVPIYSGGLGILSGDHLKSASDINIPLVAVGLLYQEGYFQQYLNNDGWQMESYPANSFDTMPVTQVLGADGQQVKVHVRFKERQAVVSVWKCQVGRVPLFLLDTDLDENPPDIRATTAQLYGGDREMRIRQEIVLGIGGIRALKAMGLTPTVVHMNEGHSAFSALERINLLRKDHGLSFDAAREVVRGSTVFTTHTPVPAGNDTFTPDLARAYFDEYARELGVSWPVLLGYGRVNPRDDGEPFGVTPLSLRLSAHANGVSKLHGLVSRHMWQGIWPKTPVEDTPIDSLTNGIHVSSWASREISRLFTRYLGQDWKDDPDPSRIWEFVSQIPLSELWRAHCHCRERLVAFARRALFRQLKRQGQPADVLRRSMELFGPDTLTIGFARRFATYKRATLLFSDPDRLDRILNNPEKPVQIIIAGKAHPQDNEGKAFIKQIIHYSREERFNNRIIFIENYNIRLASLLTAGCDVWLNNPRRPLEACGTSGMKAVANGVLNLSVLDGWWDEGYSPKYGWAIGSGEVEPNQELQDMTESQALYNLLEHQVVPSFYTRTVDGIPVVWCEMMRSSIKELVPRFSSHRMVKDYYDRFYRQSSDRYSVLTANNFAPAAEQAAWCNRLMTSWNEVSVADLQSDCGDTKTVGENVCLEARVRLGGNLRPEDVTVEAYFGTMDHQGEFANRETMILAPSGQPEPDVHVFRGQIPCERPGRFGYTVRVTPSRDKLGNPFVLGLVTWA